MLLAGEIATGKSAFVKVLVEPNHPSIHSPIHPALSSAHLRHVLSRGVHSQTQAGSFLGYHQDSKGSLLFLMEDLHLAGSGEELGGGNEGKATANAIYHCQLCHLNAGRRKSGEKYKKLYYNIVVFLYLPEAKSNTCPQIKYMDKHYLEKPKP